MGLPHDGEAVEYLSSVDGENSQFLVSVEGDPIEAIVEATYPDLLDNLMNNQYFNDRAILALFWRQP